MKKLVILLLMLVIVSTGVSAITFNEPTIFSQDNIKYVFYPGVKLDTFDFSTNSIIINNDYRLTTIPKGGTLEINFYELNEKNNVIGIKSNVPQSINFRVTVNGSKYYLFDGNEYFLDNVNIKTDETNFSYVAFNNEKTVSKSQVIIKNSWFKRNILIITIPEINDFFEKRYIYITNISLLFFILGIVLFIYIVHKLLIRGVKH